MTENSLADHLDAPRLTVEVASALRATLFTNRLSVSPRRVNQLAADLVARFFSFYTQPDEAATQTYGASLAQEGLSARSVLWMTEAVRRSAYQHPNSSAELPEVAASFCNALLEGFMAGQTHMLLEQQERTHRAHLAALGRDRD